MTQGLLISVATEMEISPLLSLSSIVSREEKRNGQVLIKATLKGKSFRLIIAGPGVFNTLAGIIPVMETATPPSRILQTGIAGVFRQTGLGIGDIAVADSVRYIHTGIEPYPDEGPPLPLPFDLIPGQPETRTGSYPLLPALTGEATEIINKKMENSPYRTLHGPVITVSTITATPARADTLYTCYNPLMEAMEGSAAAHAATVYGAGFLEIRSASNITGVRDKTAWDIPLAARHACLACAALIEEMSFE